MNAQKDNTAEIINKLAAVNKEIKIFRLEKTAV